MLNNKICDFFLEKNNFSKQFEKNLKQFTKFILKMASFGLNTDIFH